MVRKEVKYGEVGSKVLDIGAARGAFVLRNAMQNPLDTNVMLDVNPSRIAVDTPQGVFDYVQNEAFNGTGIFYDLAPELFNPTELSARYYLAVPDRSPTWNGSYRSLVQEYLPQLLTNGVVKQKLNIRLEQVKPKWDEGYIFSSGVFRCDGEMPLVDFLYEEMPNSFEWNFRNPCNSIVRLIADGRDLPFADNSFDLVYLNGIGSPLKEEFAKEGRRVAIDNTVLYYDGASHSDR